MQPHGNSPEQHIIMPLHFYLPRKRLDACVLESIEASTKRTCKIDWRSVALTFGGSDILPAFDIVAGFKAPEHGVERFTLVKLRSHASCLSMTSPMPSWGVNCQPSGRSSTRKMPPRRMLQKRGSVQKSIGIELAF